jgi:hypothetical protein
MPTCLPAYLLLRIPGVAIRSKLLHEYDARTARARVVRDLGALESHRLVELYGPFMPSGTQALDPPHPGGSASLGKLLVESLSDPSPTVVRVNSNEMHVPSRGRPRHQHREQEADHLSVELGN